MVNPVARALGYHKDPPEYKYQCAKRGQDIKQRRVLQQRLHDKFLAGRTAKHRADASRPSRSVFAGVQHRRGQVHTLDDQNHGKYLINIVPNEVIERLRPNPDLNPNTSYIRVLKQHSMLSH